MCSSTRRGCDEPANLNSWSSLRGPLLGCLQRLRGSRTCGDGTQEADGECRSQLACGNGTTEQGGECVSSVDGLTCGVGTIRQDDTCVSLSVPVTCGEGTQQEDGTCVSTLDPVTCAVGTELDDSGESCVAISPLTCGAATSEVSGECVSTPCASGTVEADGECVPIELSDSAELDGLCPKFARNFCESLARCECTDEDNPLSSLLSADLEYCQAYVENMTCINTSLLLSLGVGTGQLEANVAAINSFADTMAADEACQIDIPPFLIPATIGTYLFDLLSGLVGEAEPCIFTNACADPTHVCRFATADAEEELCLVPAALGEHCNSFVDCQSTLYCSSESDTCQPRFELTESCSRAEPCVDTACCRDGVCVALPAATEACCDLNTCGASDALYCSAGECVSYALEGDACGDGVLCSPDLRCDDYGDGSLCYARMPFCEL